MNEAGNKETQSQAGKAVLALAYVMVTLQAGFDVVLQGMPGLATGAILVLAAFATLAVQRKSKMAADVVAVCLVGQAIVCTAAFQGHPWQIDTHMIYFVMLAGISTLGSIRALLLGAGVTALHHLGLAFVLPALAYPSADLFENLARTGLHGALVVFETGVLVLSMRRDQRMVRQITEQSESLADQSHRAEIAESKARTLIREAETAIGILRGTLHELSERRLDCRIDGEMPEAFEDLRTDYNLAVDQLDAALSKALGMAQSFDGEARLLGALIDDLANGTRSQADGLGQQSRHVAQLSERLEEASAQAQRAADRVAKARREADQGGEITGQAVAAMSRIEKSSDEVGKIMDLIDDIAFQTNLLALNAGVEAARAGASGRGFAVVAGEVQALSQRTADAARGVKDLISSSEEEVASGARLVHEAGRRLSLIVEQVNEVNALIEDIRGDAGERAAEMATLSQQMASLDSEAQKILEQSAEMGGSGHRLQSHADELASLMGQFSVKQRQSDEEESARLA
ncbi:methyl-accepting chemotaxis protein [Pacificoceanicola onchidii]|uniref:methyl-accepting chemotaxis protein n=1 Tax=Pacificoceanicola onchidii TaxID=2562685 RepID=UPI0010A6AA8C|nr:methyl-accepting chemotaxis protein [Pacificoceanicola onchidii]